MSAVRIFSKFKELFDVTWGSIADGQLLVRSGTNIVGTSSAGGDVTGAAASVDGELPLYTGTSGKALKRCNIAGFVKAAASGAATAQAQMGATDLAPTAISGQTAKTTLDAADKFLLWDSVSSQLRSLTGSFVQPVGSAIQTVTSSEAAYASTNTVIPLDDTKPQITEGLAIPNLDIVITPYYANSKIVLRFDGAFGPIASVSVWAIAALFRDSGPDALACRAVFCQPVTFAAMGLTFSFTDVPGAGAHTYRMRFGSHVGTSSVVWNGSSSRNFGGVSFQTLVAQEIKV